MGMLVGEVETGGPSFRSARRDGKSLRRCGAGGEGRARRVRVTLFGSVTVSALNEISSCDMPAAVLSSRRRAPAALSRSLCITHR